MTDLRRTDEDAWVIPDEWLAKATPWRGRGPVTSPKPDPKALALVRTWLADEQVSRRVEATAAAGEEELAAAARATLADPAHATGLGIAVAARLAIHFVSDTRSGPAPIDRLADAWVALYGPVSAAEAAARFSGLNVTRNEALHEWCATHAPPSQGLGVSAIGLLTRLRGYVAGLPDDDYRMVVERLGRCRVETASLATRLVTSYLAPSQQGWLDEDLNAAPTTGYYQPDAWQLLAGSATTAAQLARVPRAQYIWGRPLPGRAELIRSVLEVGPDAAAFVAAGLDVDGVTVDDQRMVSGLLAGLPTDEAFLLLLDRADRPAVRAALITAVYRFPHRASRLLAQRLSTPMADRLSRLLARVYPEFAEESAAGSGRGRGTAHPVARLAEADLPDLLRTPPWERDLPPTVPTVLRGLATTRPLAVSWLPGEREEWANIPVPHHVPHSGWEAEIVRLRNDSYTNGYGLLDALAFGPEDLMAPHVRHLPADSYWNSDGDLRRVLGRFGDAAAEVIFAVVQTNAINSAPLLLPVTGTAVTTLMTRMLDTRRGRTTALTWFERHIASAAPDLVAAALDKPGKQRVLAWKALHTLDGRGHRPALLAAAAGLSERAATAIEVELSTDPLALLPTTIPTLPSWLVPAALSPIILRDKGPDGAARALPPSAAAVVCTMLALCGPAADYAGIAHLTELAEPDSLAAFAWDLFDTWELAGCPSDDNWILHALGLLGNDDAARRLAPLIRVWPGENAHARAVSGLDVLVAIGTDVALMQLNGIAEKVKFKGIKTKAQEKIRQLAEESGLTAEELGDRLVPTCGLSDDGTLSLDYGPRAFTIGFDEQLRPTVAEADGTPRKSLPKPGAKDDPELAPAAYQTFTLLKKDVKAVAAEQIRRLERAMVRNRRWTPEVHRQLFIDHPLLWHLSRRLVWGAFAPDGTLTTSFRIAEDRTLADAEDDTVTLPDDALIGIAHPLHLAHALASWGEIFADYEVLQPFPQLRRETHHLAEEDRATALDRFQGVVVPVGDLLGLTRFGWQRGTPMDAGVENEMYRPLTESLTAVIDLDPGIAVGMVHELGDQKISVHLTLPGQESAWGASRTERSVADLDPVDASELLRELHILTAASQ